MEPAHRRAVVVVEQARRLGETGRQAFGVLEPSALESELVLLPGPESGGVELGHLQALQVLALGAIALGGARSLELGPGGPVLREQITHAVAELVGIGESIEQVELPRGLEQTLVLVLPVHLDPMIAAYLQQAHR